MRAPRLALALLILGAGLHVIPSPGEGGAAYRGTVVDAETKAPLEGAVVVVVWRKKPLITMDGPQYFHKAVEALTDATGRFSVDASPGIDWNPFTYVLKEPTLVIFAPGYGPFPWAHVKTPSVAYETEAFRRDGAVVELPRLKTREELLRATETVFVGLPPLMPHERIPHLIRLVNIQRKSLGLQSYPEPVKRGRKP